MVVDGPRRTRHKSHHSRRKAPPPEEVNNSEDDVDVIDVDEIRRSRAEFYGTPAEDRIYHEDSMPREGHTEVKSHRKRRSHKSSSVVGTSRTSTSGTHRRRRKRESQKAQDVEEADFVYQRPAIVAEDEGEVKPVRRRRRSLASISDKNAVVVPPRVRALRTLGLQPPQRTTSQRSIRRSKPDEERRRHSYQDGSGSRSTARLSSVREGRVLGEGRTLTEEVAKPKRTASKSSSRPSISRSNTTTTRSRKVTPSMPTVTEEGGKTQSGTKLGRSNSAFGSLFGPQRTPKPEAKVTCLTCMDDDIPISRSAKLSCTHRMCHPCLKRVFTMSVKDPAHMPPRCCTQDCIPLKHVEKLFSDAFKVRWNRKYQEFTTKNRIYCPAKGCGTWIPPRDMSIDGITKRRYGRCSKCRTKVCVKCNRKWHGARACTNDEETIQFQEIAKEAGWQKCFNCSAMVELKEGCNHMTCRCTAEFCMICGSKWKSCDCPWFNYAAVENDRLNHMNVAEVRREPWRAEEVQPRGYQEELERRRVQERRDEELARRMQHLDIDTNLRPRREGRNNAGGGGVFALGNAAGHFMNADFVNRATNILTSRYDPATREAADRLVQEIRDGQRAANLGSLETMAPDPAMNRSPGRAATMARRSATTRRAVGIVTGAGRQAEILVPRQAPTMDYASGAERHNPNAVAPPVHDPAKAPAAIQAGLQRMSNTGRVDAWRRHVTSDEGMT